MCYLPRGRSLLDKQGCPYSTSRFLLDVKFTLTVLLWNPGVAQGEKWVKFLLRTIVIAKRIEPTRE